MLEINLKQAHNNPSGGEGQRNRIHPHKFTLWVAIASIIMMFAGLTSAYIVKSSLANWVEVSTPNLFWYSTAVMIISSITIQASLRAFRQREMSKFMFCIILLGVFLFSLPDVRISWKLKIEAFNGDINEVII